ncbi:MAG: hypothetical protein LUF92_02550, partial [Clostridiales bacterium]|nr:hypothetical protein [Clostridiales bacterium]
HRSVSPTSDPITRNLQGYRDSRDTDEMTTNAADARDADSGKPSVSSQDKSPGLSLQQTSFLSQEENDPISTRPDRRGENGSGSIYTDRKAENGASSTYSNQQRKNNSSSTYSGRGVENGADSTYMGRKEEKVPVSTHPDRREQGFRLYPKNTLIKGPLKTGKYHEAILTAVGIIEGKEMDMMRIEAVPDVLEHYKNYIEECRILHVSYPDIDRHGYDGWIEDRHTLRDGIFKEYANRCGEGRYVVLMEEIDLNWMHLFGETCVLLRDNRREGTSSETAITLCHSKEPFRLPSNLYIVATCDENVGEDTILGAISQDFFIRHISPNAGVLHGMRIEGISLEDLMTTLNLRISYFLGSDFQLGEGFFLGSSDKNPFISLARVFREQLIPLLEKWFDGDIERIRYVLGDNGKQDSATIFYQETPFQTGLFKGEIPDAFDREKCIYQINEQAFLNPQSYIEIYS